MQYSELSYFLFLPLVMLLYTFTPKKFRYITLLVASLFFFYTLSGKLLIYVVYSTLIMYFASLLIDHFNELEDNINEEMPKEEKKALKLKYNKYKKITLVISILLLLSTLLLTKYLNFFITVINDVFKSGLSLTRILAPIGISFYTFEVLSYLIDIYHKKYKANKNILKCALYIVFFPTLMEGPIARYEQIKDSLFSGEKINYTNMCFALQRIVYGLGKKLIIADRLNPIVKMIFNNYSHYNGGVVLLGGILYTIQLYMDFSGIMDIVIGSGQIFNIKLPENFKQPFFSKNISDFWSRWHITLGTFFKDYIFYPISLSRISRNITKTLRKKLGSHFGPLVSGSIALLAVWLSNGLWHGAGYQYILFGMYHFVLILLGNICMPLINRFYDKTKINKESVFVKCFSILRTTILVIFGEIIFRSNSVKDALSMIKRIFTNFSFDIVKPLNKIGLDIYDMIIILVTLIVIVVISILKEKNINVREIISKKPIYIRWIIYYILILYVLIFGAYLGPYIPVDPMYANF